MKNKITIRKKQLHNSTRKTIAKLFIAFLFTLTVINSWAQGTLSSPIFSENFGTLANATAISTSNTAFSFVRLGTSATGTPPNEIIAFNPSSFFGSSALIGAKGASISTIDKTALTSFSSGTFTFKFKTPASLTSAVMLSAVGTGVSFGSANGFTGAQLSAGFQVTGTNLQIRSAGAWTTAQTVAVSTTYTVTVIFNNTGSTLTYGTGNSLPTNKVDLWVNGTLVGQYTSATAGLAASAFRIYTTTSEFEVDDIAVYNTLPSSISAPTVTNTAAANILTTSADLGGNVTTDGGSAVTGRGVVYSLTSVNAAPAVGGTGVTQLTAATATTGTYTVTATPLTVNTQYSYNAYATNAIGTSYGTSATFYTLANTPNTPTVGNATVNSLDVTIDANSNPSSTQFAIQETTSGNYVQANGSLGASAVWQTAAIWATKTVTPLGSSLTFTFQVKARNGALTETGFSSTASGTTLTPISPNLSAGALLGFGSVCLNTTTNANAFTLSGTNLDGTSVTIGPLSGFSFDAGSGYASTATISSYGTSISSTINVKLTPTSVISYNGSIPVSGGGASAISVAASGSGINTAPSVTSGTFTPVAGNTATLPGTITSNGCSSVSVYGIEYSTSNNFTPGTGIPLVGSNLSGQNFSVVVNGLTGNTPYYYRAYATNNGGTTYGAQQTFTYTCPIATITTGGTTTICSGNTVSLTATAGASYLWSNGSTSQSINAALAGAYTVTVNDGAGCVTTSLGTTVTVSTYGSASGTLISENIGTPAGTTTIAAFNTANGWQNSGAFTYSSGGAANPADIRITSPSSGYVGASGGGNIFFTTTSGVYGFEIAGFNASTYSTLTLQFGYRKESASLLPTLAIEYWNGTAYVNVPFTFNEAVNASAGWYLSPSIVLPAGASINGMKLRWTKSGTASVRIDDIKLTGSAVAISAGGPTTFCSGNSVTLTSNTGSSYLWSNGATTPSISANTSGVYSVTVTGPNGCSSTSSTTNVVVNALPTVTSTDVSGCSGTSIALSGAPLGGIFSKANPYSGPSTTYTYTYTDGNGCSNTSSASSITVNALPDATISVSNGLALTCANPSTVLFVPTPGGTSQVWNQNGSFFATASNPSVTVGATYDVTVSNTSTGCTATSSVTTTLDNTVPTVSISSSATELTCSTTSITLTAFGADSYVWSDLSTGSTHATTTPGTFTVTGTTTSNGCTASSSVYAITQDISTPDATITVSDGLALTCTNPSTTLSVPTPGGTSQVWNQNGTFFATASNPLVTVGASYDVTVTKLSNGCTSTASVTTTLDNTAPDATISASNSLAFCNGSNTVLSVPVTGTTSQVWLQNGGFFATASNPLVTIGATYSVTVTDAANGCTASASVTTAVNPLPIGSASNIVMCDGSAANLSLNSNITGTDFSWTTSVTSGTVAGNTDCSSNCGTLIADLLANTSNVHGDVTYVVTPTSPAGCVGSTFTSVVTVGAIPATPGTISGPAVVCGMNSAIYSVAAVTEATNYIWTVPSPMTITSGTGTNTIHVTVPAGTLIGNVTARAHNSCGNSLGTSVLAITKKPAVPGSISGPVSICSMSAATYSIAPVFGAASYTWTLPTGVSIASGSGTNSITVNIATTFVSGNITVAAVNACGSIPGTTITVYAKAPAASTAISGLTSICGVSTITYTATGIPGAVNYLWTLPVGLSQLSATGNSITVLNNGFTAGSISVQGNNSCGTGPAKVLGLSAATATPGVISGPNVACGQSSAVYSVAAVTGATSYIWTLPVGATITAGAGTSSIVASYTNGMIGNVSVVANNGCMNSATRNLAVSKVPSAPAAISGSTVVCGLTSSTYTIPAVAGATSYLWMLPSNMSIVSGQGTTSIVALAAANVTSGTMRAYSQTTCGNGGFASLAYGVCASPLSMDEENVSMFHVYPNPANNEFTISLNSIQNNIEMDVYEVLGNKVINRTLTNETSTINIEQLSNGLYFVRLVDANSNIIYTQRLVKE